MSNWFQVPGWQCGSCGAWAPIGMGHICPQRGSATVVNTTTTGVMPTREAVLSQIRALMAQYGIKPDLTEA